MWNWLKNMLTRGKRAARSGTDEYPAPRDLICGLLGELYARTDDDVHVTFEVIDRPDGWLQVALDKHDILINFSYPHQEPPDEFFSRLSFRWLDGFRLQSCKPGLYATYVGPRMPPETLGAWLEQFYLTVFGCPAGFQLTGHLD